MRRRSGGLKGSTLLEFTLVGIPMIFVLISTFEIARGMWLYHTLGFSVKAGTRYASVHGANCAQPPNSCTVRIRDIAAVVQSAGPGLVPDQLNMTFQPQVGSAITCLLPDCLTNDTVWPPSIANSAGMTLRIDGVYPFRSIISMFWPGAGGAYRPYTAVNFPASSTERVQF